MPEVRVSVCLATHNGGDYVTEQVRSILEQLRPGDEIVVVDDASWDDTAERVRAFADPRISLSCNETNVGYVRAFERALGLARGRYLILSDQDDVWIPGRLEAMVGALDGDAVVATSVAVLDDPSDEPRWRLRGADSHRFALNLALTMIGVRWYTGCAMGLRREILPSYLPFPPWLSESHDLWLGLIGNTHRQMRHLEAPSVWRRLHAKNQTPLGWRPLPTILRARLMMARCLVEAERRARRWQPVDDGAPT
jgi:glycosyltransferase involved in cell wall biosynthesis